MEQNRSEWKTYIMKEVFNERDSKNILAMSIINDIVEDKNC